MPFDTPVANIRMTAAAIFGTSYLVTLAADFHYGFNGIGGFPPESAASISWVSGGVEFGTSNPATLIVPLGETSIGLTAVGATTGLTYNVPEGFDFISYVVRAMLNLPHQSIAFIIDAINDDDPRRVRLAQDPDTVDSTYNVGLWVIAGGNIDGYQFSGNSTWRWLVHSPDGVLELDFSAPRAGADVTHDYEGEGDHVVIFTLVDRHGLTATLESSFEVHGAGSIGLVADELGGFYSAVKSGQDVQISYFPAGAASRDLRALLTHFESPSLGRDDTGALHVAMHSRSIDRWQQLVSRDGGRNFFSF